MTQSIDIPIWLVIILAIFTAIALVDRIFAPSVRWYFRRRVNDAIDELNSRLDLRIRPFKLTRKQTLVDQLLYDQNVIDAVELEHENTGKPRMVLMKEAKKYAEEIVPSFSPLAYFGIGTRGARWISEFVYRVRLGYTNDDALKQVPKDATVVFVMNHRSNMDYMLVTYMASNRASLSYAVGEWANVWLLQSLFRSMGAYFIRRNSKNPLYRKVLASYVQKATKEGVTQAVFPEGGLSRDGKLSAPKLGLISYMIAGFNAEKDRDIIFIPVGINYDRVLEDRILTSRKEKEATGRDFRVKLSAIASFVWNLIKLRFQGRLYRYGHACVSFGKPISLATFATNNNVDFSKHSENDITINQKNRKAHFDGVEKLGEELLREIGAIIPALPVALVSTVLWQNMEKPIGELELKSLVFKLIQQLEKHGSHVHIPREDRDYTLTTGIRMLTLRHILTTDENGLYKTNSKERLLLEYYANSIAHLIDVPKIARKSKTKKSDE